MRRQLAASIAVLVLALVFGCERTATDTGQAGAGPALAQLDTDPGCTDEDCPPPPDPGCTDEDCPPDPGCTDEDCPPPPDPGCTDEDCPPDPGCTDEDCPPDPGCTDEDCPPYPPALSIDIKPGSYPNSWGCSAVQGALPVAIISAADFDAMNVDANLVRFGRNGSEAEEVHRAADGSAKRHEEDVNGDGLLDLVFHFRFGDTGFSCDDIPAGEMEKTVIGFLRGKTLDGDDISAVGELRLVKG